MIKVSVDTTITDAVVKKIISLYNSDNICIVIENTKKQLASQLEEIAKKYPNIMISVLGGLNPKKNKFNHEHYQRRTYYKPLELSKIIRIFNIIERKIDISWTETQKVMFVYRELCNNMEYSECTSNGRDVARNLSGLLYRKAVCSGFAMILKEALDRLGIENVYQNRESHHSWNIAYIDGNYRALELTWDCYSKKEHGCGFKYFNRVVDFYKNEHHNIQSESEEKEYPIVPYNEERLKKDLEVISSSKIITFPLKRAENTTIKISDENYVILKTVVGGWLFGKNVKNYVRSDGSRFAIAYVGTFKNLNKYVCLDLTNPQKVMASKIYSESRLDKLNSEYDSVVANGLLSKERLHRKIEQFNGYVGFIGKNHTIYYDENFEKQTLNIIR